MENQSVKVFDSNKVTEVFLNVAHVFFLYRIFQRKWLKLNSFNTIQRRFWTKKVNGQRVIDVKHAINKRELALTETLDKPNKI